MLKKVLPILVVLCSLLWAGDAGSVTGVGVIVGNNGIKYIHVKHTQAGVDFNSGSNKLTGEFFIPWDENDPAYNASMLSILKDALKDPNIHLIASEGTTSDKIVSYWVPVITRFNIQK